MKVTPEKPYKATLHAMLNLTRPALRDSATLTPQQERAAAILAKLTHSDRVALLRLAGIEPHWVKKESLAQLAKLIAPC